MKNLVKMLSTGALTASLALGLAGCATENLKSRFEKANAPIVSPTAKKDVYVKLLLERTNDSDSIKFNSLNFLNGDFSGMSRPHYRSSPSEYVLESYDEKGRLLSQYDLKLPGPIIAESFSGKVQATFLNNPRKTFDVYFPYDPETHCLKINHWGKRKDLEINPECLRP